MSQTVAVPRPAASLILLRDGSDGPEVMMVERTGSASFAAGKFVFPGGTKDAADETLASGGTPDAALRVTAIRETYEECGLLLVEPEPAEVAPAASFQALLETGGYTPATHRLTPFAHWITPPHLPKRFDTRFFIARGPSRQVAAADLREVMSAVWLRPRAVVAAAEAAELNLMFATYMNLRWLARFASVADALAAAETRQIVTVVPEPADTPEGRVFRIPEAAGYGETAILEHRFRRG
ncbi:MAG TPA: NUDIX domain-containing protein [Ferrovibrio sp.]|jgi:8-oxo-dGTP pyrophosphatase MutT (NUDIX family)|uniref:NUDIX hydrolase n=1 Tax=Ferrovibrio sp. TaxID=1917215 RepID=UPI002B4B6A5A|nr:NUDIX domain-containing protein [Ferrovibrio sp.]HLT78884.1 NUDIX domain-containing protein [Ferrovibrio sp.]